VIICCGGFSHEVPSKSWFIGISTLGTFIGWWTINLTFLRFCKLYCRFPRLTNWCRPSFIRGCLPSSACGPSRQDAICLHFAPSAIPWRLGNVLDHVLHPRQRFYRVLQVGRIRVPHFVCVAVCWAVRNSLTWISRHQHPDLHCLVPWLQTYQQDQDPQAKGCRPRDRHSSDGRDGKARNPPKNSLGQDRCRSVLNHRCSPSLPRVCCRWAAFMTLRIKADCIQV